MEIKKGFKLASVIFASTIVLAACGNDDAAKEESSEVASSEVMSNEDVTGELKDGSYKLEEKWKITSHNK